MKIHAVLLASALLATGVGVSAEAATKAKPKPMCKNVIDDKGDVVLTQAAPESATPDPALDLVSADLGSNSKVVTAAIRVDKLARPASTSPAGTVYELRVTHAKSDLTYVLWAHVTGATATYGVGTVDTSSSAEIAESTGTATGVVDLAKSEIRITAPYSALGGAKLGLKAGIDSVVVKRSAANQYYGRYSDDASGGKSFVFGAASCVKVGG